MHSKYISAFLAFGLSPLAFALPQDPATVITTTTGYPPPRAAQTPGPDDRVSTGSLSLGNPNEGNEDYSAIHGGNQPPQCFTAGLGLKTDACMALLRSQLPFLMKVNEEGTWSVHQTYRWDVGHNLGYRANDCVLVLAASRVDEGESFKFAPNTFIDQALEMVSDKKYGCGPLNPSSPGFGGQQALQGFAAFTVKISRDP